MGKVQQGSGEVVQQKKEQIELIEVELLDFKKPAISERFKGREDEKVTDPIEFNVREGRRRTQGPAPAAPGSEIGVAVEGVEAY